MPKHDLAILVPKNVCAFDFATFDEEERFDIGKEVLCISHTGNFMYTLMIGHLACQDHRLLSDVEDEPKKLVPWCSVQEADSSDFLLLPGRSSTLRFI
ncbi:hypothetical protein RHMOL_Rhmol05G0228100 [Rhododendron molle]|uniref:Uncharacterized protein n=1 Tax=Rhododendron molle TaxID=49168 RepID=A0ACC0NT84_RHOML|nr:hypothetical protein RHMOL_Rhmol05G0228100 [Rhododendron molle]